MNKEQKFKYKILNNFELSELLNASADKIAERMAGLELDINDIEDAVSQGFSKKNSLNKLEKLLKEYQKFEKEINKILKINDELEKSWKQIQIV